MRAGELPSMGRLRKDFRPPPVATNVPVPTSEPIFTTFHATRSRPLRIRRVGEPRFPLKANGAGGIRTRNQAIMSRLL